jgi:hypothetical protein
MYACLQLKFAKFCATFAKRRSTRKLESESVERKSRANMVMKLTQSVNFTNIF